MTLALQKRSVSLAGRPFALLWAWFLHVERRHLREAWFQIYKFNMAAMSQHWRRRQAIFRSFFGLRKDFSLRQLKPEKGALRKQLTVSSLPSNLCKKSFFHWHLVEAL